MVTHDVTSSLHRRLLRVLRDVKTPTVSKLIEQRKGYARKRKKGDQAGPGNSKTVHDTCEVEIMHTLHEALRRYDDGVRAGLELHDRKTMSLLVTACSLSGSLWAEEQLPRALGLFERTWTADSIDPRTRLDRRSEDRDGPESHADVAAPVGLPPVLPRCSHPQCDEVAGYGSAVAGLARSCARHCGPSEVRVELDNMALNVLSESCVRRGGMLQYGARLLQYQLERPGPRGGPFDWQHTADADCVLLALTRLFFACARAEAVPRAAIDLLPYLVSPELSAAGGSLRARRRACLNALLFACGAAAMPAAAAAVHRRTLEAGVAPDLAAINAVVSAFGRAGKLDEALEVFHEARRQPETLEVARDSYVITSLLHACAVRRDAVRAEQLYEAALQANVVPTKALLNALCSAQATAGNIEAATRTFEDMRRLGRDIDGGQQQPEGRPQEGWSQEGIHHKEPRHYASEEDTALATVLNACNMAQQPQRALELAERLLRDGFRPASPAPYVQLLRACAGRPSRASAVWEAALASGIRPSSAMLNALVRACAAAGDMQAAFRAARRGQTHGLPPDVGTVNALLHGCMVSREVPNAWRCMRLAEELGVEPNTKTHNLLLAAHLAALQRAPWGRSGARDEEMLRQAQQLYERGLDLGWEWQQSTKRWLLRICAVRNQMPYALRMVAEMEARGDELFAPLNDLVHACHRVNQVDDEALQLWEEGGRLSDERRKEPQVTPDTHESPPLLTKPS